MSASKTLPTLLPCPFCGEKAAIQRSYIGRGGYSVRCESAIDKQICPTRPQTWHTRTKFQAAMAWNKRHKTKANRMVTKKKAPDTKRKAPNKVMQLIRNDPRSSNAVTLGQAIKEGRLSCGLKQTDLSKSLNTNSANISRLESGRSHPTRATLEKIAKALGKNLIIRFE